jgi:MATE family multidrug resistance protein
MAAFMAAYIRFKPDYRRYGVFSRFEWPRVEPLVGLLKIGLPVAVSLFMESSLFGVVALLMGSLGTTIVGGHQIAINFAAMTFMIPLGLAMAVTVRVGHAIGRGEPNAARFSGFVGVSLAALFMTCTAVTLFTIPNMIAGIYTDDPDVKKMAAMLLTLAGVFQIFDGLQVSGSGALRGLKDTRIPMLITTFAYWGIGMPLGYVLGITWGGGPRGLWTGFICGLATAAILLNRRFHRVTQRLIAHEQTEARTTA